MTAPVVLVHGGGFASQCWDRLLPHLDTPVIAVDLPGRGRRPADLRTVTLADCARAIVADADMAGFDEVVLAGHSLAGCSLPAAVGLLGARALHAVFIGATVPPSGTSSFDTLDPEIQQMAREGAEPDALGVMDAATATMMFGNDLDEEQLAWCLGQMVPEAPKLIFEPVDLSPLRGVPCTWMRTLHDAIVSAPKQARFAANIPECDVVDVDAAHMCMISKPAETAAILNEIAARY